MPQSTAPLSTGSGVDKAVVYAVYRQAKAMGASEKVMISLFEACIVESGFRNINYGDRDSVGVLQQRSQGWGTYAERMNPASAASKFIARAKQLEGRYSTPGRLAQAVQVSAFPLRYDAAYPRAVALLRDAQKNAGDAATTPTAPGAPTTGGTATGALTNAADLLSNRQTWIRLLLILLGILLISIAIIRMSVQSDTVKGAAKLAVNFVPGGGVVSTGVKAVAGGKLNTAKGIGSTAKGIGKAIKATKEVAKTP